MSSFPDWSSQCLGVFLLFFTSAKFAWFILKTNAQNLLILRFLSLQFVVYQRVLKGNKENEILKIGFLWDRDGSQVRKVNSAMLTRLLKNKKETYVATSKFWSYAKINGSVDLFFFASWRTTLKRHFLFDNWGQNLPSKNHFDVRSN